MPDVLLNSDEKPFSDMVDLVAPDVPGCPDVVIERAILNATRTFCQKTTWLRLHDVGPIAPVADVENYDLSDSLPDLVEVVSILSAYQGKRPLHPLPSSQVSKSKSLTATHFLHPGASHVGLHPIPLGAGLPVYLVVAIKPALAATGAYSALLDEFEQEIVHGAKAELKLQRQPWRDVELADYHMKEFRAGCGKALIRALRGNTGVGYRIVPEVV